MLQRVLHDVRVHRVFDERVYYGLAGHDAAGDSARRQRHEPAVVHGDVLHGICDCHQFKAVSVYEYIIELGICDYSQLHNFRECAYSEQRRDPRAIDAFDMAGDRPAYWI